MVRRISRAAVIGSGIMGSGIASLLAGVGIKTLLLDIVPPNLKDQEKNSKKIRNSFAQAGVDMLLKSNPPQIMHKKDIYYITIGNIEDDFEKISECDWIFEVIVENLEAKRGLLKKIEVTRKLGSIVSSNTSGIPLNSMSDGLNLEFKQHFIGTHFFNPVRYMKLLEIIATNDTSSEVFNFVSEFGKSVLGKGIVKAKDTPNFIGNRIGVHGMLKSMQLMLEEDLNIPEIDALFGRPLGRPKTGMFKTADLVGLDVLAHVASNTYDLVEKDEDRDCFLIPKFLDDMVNKKLLGKKTQKGFYKTDLDPDWKIIRKVINPKTMEYHEYEKVSFPCLREAKNVKKLSEKINIIVYGKDRGSKFTWKALASNLIYSVNRIPEISDTIVEIDNAMKWGYNFEMGPFEIWDIIGLKKSVDRMKTEGFPVPKKINRMLDMGIFSFYRYIDDVLCFFDFISMKYKNVKKDISAIYLSDLKRSNKVVKSSKSASLLDLGNDVFCLEFHTKMNAINAEIVDFMQICTDYVVTNGIGLVVGNQSGGIPGNFSAGGDLTFMLSLAERKKYDEINAFLKNAQSVMQYARYADIPIVAAPYGLTLGGGCEVCLGVADRIVAHCDLYMGLVEIGVGLLPSGGGCLNIWKKMVSFIPESVLDIDLTKIFIPTFMSVVTAKVSSSAADALANGFLGKEDRIVFNRDYLLDEAKKEVLRIVDDGYKPPIRRSIRVAGAAVRGMVNAEIFNMKSAKFISEYDAFLAKRIAFVMSGGDVGTNSFVDEEVVLNLEREAFIDFWKQSKTVDRVSHMLRTGRPLRN